MSEEASHETIVEVEQIQNLIVDLAESSVELSINTDLSISSRLAHKHHGEAYRLVVDLIEEWKKQRV